MSDTPNPLAELESMKKVAEAMEGLESESIHRVLRWANDMYGVEPSAQHTKEVAPTAHPQVSATAASLDPLEFEDFAEMYAATQPNSDSEKALVTSYWLQYKEGQANVDTQSVNTMLKHMGHGVGNITRAFDSLTKTKPQVVVQLRKSGSSKQARKTFKVTYEGKKAVEAMLSNNTY
ncbi:MAG: hypothetical protein COB19_05750 [Porticoccus sp.]|nr:MAG: hypothetical protein COB19_05750 [Porticoccus sp.]